MKKKAAKKASGKAAKEAAKHAGKKGAKSPGRDTRRGFEHLHRLHVLSGSLAGDALEQVQTLTLYAQAAFRLPKPKSAADLLRAAEHLAFASLSTPGVYDAVSGEVRKELKDELEHLLDRASSDWESQEPSRAIRKLYKDMRSSAKAAWKAKTYGRALEFARAADAIAHANPEKLRIGKGESLEQAAAYRDGGRLRHRRSHHRSGSFCARLGFRG